MTRMKNSGLKITPLGGVGQIGSNITLLKYHKTEILIDAGILFPYEDFFDINYLIPDLDYIETPPSYLVITHGHEDHIGAIALVLKKFPDIEVYASPFAKALIEYKLKEAQINHKIHLYHANSTLTLGDFEVSPIHVNHSIPETHGLFISSSDAPWGLFFVSDYKIDDRTKYESYFDFPRLKKLSQDKKERILMCDSTNILSRQKKTLSEFDLINDLEFIISNSGRCFVTFFASNIHRMQTFVNLGSQLGKRCVLHGGSVNKYAQIALGLGLLKDPDNILVDSRSVSPDQDNLMVLCSGCQADFKGAMRRVIIGEDSIFKPKPDDTFIFSSKPIPGNEKKISLLYNKIAHIGARLITADDYQIHASGHPGTDDIELLLDQYNPNLIIPIHGESLFIKKFEDYLQKKHPQISTRVVFNFDTYDLEKDTIEAGKALDPIIIHGKNIVIERARISERRKLACNGAIFISISKNEISVSYQGLPEFAHQHKDNHLSLIKDALRDLRKNLSTDATAEKIRVLTRQYFSSLLGYRPIAIVHVIG